MPMTQWGREHLELAQTLGFTREQTPCVATLHLAFSRLDKAAFKAALKDGVLEGPGDGGEAVAIDGKSLGGIHGEELPGVHLAAAYAQGAGPTKTQGTPGDWGCSLCPKESEPSSSGTPTCRGPTTSG